MKILKKIKDFLYWKEQEYEMDILKYLYPQARWGEIKPNRNAIRYMTKEEMKSAQRELKKAYQAYYSK